MIPKPDLGAPSYSYISLALSCPLLLSLLSHSPLRALSLSRTLFLLRLFFICNLHCFLYAPLVSKTLGRSYARQPRDKTAPQITSPSSPLTYSVLPLRPAPTLDENSTGTLLFTSTSSLPPFTHQHLKTEGITLIRPITLHRHSIILSTLINMSTTVHVSNISSQTSEHEVRDFFSFW